MGSIAITDPLFESVRLGALTLKHRVILAPLTRMRAGKESEGVYVPNELNVEYYSQRASEGGFMLTEATPISRHVCKISVLEQFEQVMKLTFSGCWIPRSPWHLYFLADRGLEEGYRCRAR